MSNPPTQFQDSVGGIDFLIKNSEDIVAHFGSGSRISGEEDQAVPGNRKAFIAGGDDDDATENDAASQ